MGTLDGPRARAQVGLPVSHAHVLLEDVRALVAYVDGLAPDLNRSFERLYVVAP